MTPTLSMNARITELRIIGPDEGISPSDASEIDLRKFSAAFGDPAAIFLLDNGNYRARWHNAVLSTAVEFKGNGDMHILHLPRAALSQGEQP